MAISYNEPIMFGSAGTAKTLNCSGIDFSEDGFESWTHSPVAEMDISLPIARQDVVLEIHAAPFVVPDSIIAQNVFIFMGGSSSATTYWPLRSSESSRSPVT